MDTTENTEKAESAEDSPKRFSFLVLLASVLSVASLAWTTWSLLDLFQVDALQISWLNNVSLIGLSTAATMDIVWGATMIAEYQGQKLPVSWKTDKGENLHSFNVLPFVGWIEVLFVAGLLGYHGSTVAGGAAMFAAILPVFTKLTWVLALNGLKDPTDLTEDEKAEIALTLREGKRIRAKAQASTEKHAALALEKNRIHAEALADQRRQNEIALEKTQADIAKQKMEQQAKFDLDKAELEGQADNKLMRQRLNAQLQIETLRTQQNISLERMDAEQEMRLRAPLDLGYNVIRGQVSRPQLTKGTEGDEFDEETSAFDGLNLTLAERRKVEMAARYFAADASEGGITKAAFAKKIQTTPPRVTEATTAFPLEWFVENGLATWQA